VREVPRFPYVWLVRIPALPLLAVALFRGARALNHDKQSWLASPAAYAIENWVGIFLFLCLASQLIAVPFAIWTLGRSAGSVSGRHLAALLCGVLQIALGLTWVYTHRGWA
jgi:hypothetical protein